MTTTTNVEQVKLNIMTSAQYSSATKNANELYMLTDATISYNDLSNKPDLSVYAQDADVVHKTDDETISGLKTFANSGLDFLNTSVTKGVNPSGYKYWAIRINANNAASSWADNRLGLWETRLDTNGNTNMYFGVYKNEAGSQACAMIQCVYNKSGNYGYATAPASDVNGSIVTTVDKSKSANGYFKLGNGLIVNWGKTDAVEVANSTVGTLVASFSKAYTTTPQVVTTTNNNTTNANYGYVNSGVASVSTTGFTLAIANKSSGKTNSGAFWIAIGY